MEATVHSRKRLEAAHRRKRLETAHSRKHLETEHSRKRLETAHSSKHLVTAHSRKRLETVYSRKRLAKGHTNTWMQMEQYLRFGRSIKLNMVVLTAYIAYQLFYKDLSLDYFYYYLPQIPLWTS